MVQLQAEVQQLATSVQGYADYLVQKNKQMKLVHANATPVRTVSDMSVKFLKISPITKAHRAVNGAIANSSISFCLLMMILH